MRDFNIFMETSAKNIEEVNTSSDIVYVHDPQPIALVKKKLQEVPQVIQEEAHT